MSREERIKKIEQLLDRNGLREGYPGMEGRPAMVDRPEDRVTEADGTARSTGPDAQQLA